MSVTVLEREPRPADSAFADQVLDAKMADIAGTGAQIVVVSNTGCHMQIIAGVRKAGLKVEVLHSMELLDRAYI